MKVAGRVLLAALGLLLAVGTILAGPSSDERLLSGLRERRLFSLAEKYCRDQLAHSELAIGRRSELVSELARTLAAHAVETVGDERQQLFVEADRAIEEFRREYPKHPRLLLVRMQGALGALARGELERQEAELSAAGGPQADSARAALRTAIAQLKQLNVETSSELLRRNRAARLEAGQLTAAELMSLESNIRYELARAYRNQALCYPAGSADRINALTQAAELLGPLALLTRDDALAWPSRGDEVVCLRLLENFAAAERRLSDWAKDSPPAAVQARLVAETMRLLLARGRVEAALELVDLPVEQAGYGAADLDYARLEVMIAAWQKAHRAANAARAAELEQLAARQVRAIEKSHGAYWTRRAETLLAASIASAPGAENVEALRRLADSYFRGGRVDDALAAYDRAAALARSQQKLDVAFDLGFKAATIEHERGRRTQAVARYRDLAIALPSQLKAAEAHQLAIYNAAQLAAAGDAAAVDRYEKLLQEHLERWPKAKSAGKVYWWLGTLEEHRRDWPKAVAAYKGVPADDPQFEAAIIAAGRCYQAWIAGLRGKTQPHEELASEAAQYFERLILVDGKPPRKWSPPAHAAALAAGRIWLGEVSWGAARAEAVLTAALDGSAEAPAEWKASVRALLVTALAGQGRLKDAASMLEQISAGSPDDLLDMLDGLSRTAAARSPKLRHELAELQLAAAALLKPRRAQLGEKAQRRLGRIEAAALTDSGRATEALALLERLAKQYPRDGQVQEDLAALLAASDEQDTLRLALKKWRDIEQKSQPGSARWFRANLALAQTHLKHKSKPDARTIIKLVQSAHPDFGGPELREKFLKLLAECEK